MNIWRFMSRHFWKDTFPLALLQCTYLFLFPTQRNVGMYTQLVLFLISVIYWARKRLDFQGPNLTNIEQAQLLGKVFGITWNKMMPTPDEPQLQVSKKRPGPHFKKNCLPFKSSGKVNFTRKVCNFILDSLIQFFRQIIYSCGGLHENWGITTFSPFLFCFLPQNWIEFLFQAR